MEQEPENQSFDEYAAHYDRDLAQGLSVSGEDKTYFAKGRIAWLSRCLNQLQEKPATVLDFGCGVGTATPYLIEIVRAASLVGVDISAKSLEVARQSHSFPNARYLLLKDYQPPGDLDLAFCNGVFHHIPLAERAGAVHYVHRSLRPGGLFALWENNPWNPGTRIVMSRIPFDREAIMVSALEARKLLRAGGFEIVRTDFIFIFPHPLRWFRGIEPLVSKLPVGAQLQVLARKPQTKGHS